MKRRPWDIEKHERIDVGTLRRFQRGRRRMAIHYLGRLGLPARRPDPDTIYVRTLTERHPSGDGRIREVSTAHIFKEGEWVEVGTQKTAWRQTRKEKEKRQ